MWNLLSHIIKDTTKDSLVVASRSARTQSAYRESWWFIKEVKTKAAVKQTRFKELLLCQEGHQKDETLWTKKISRKDGESISYLFSTISDPNKVGKERTLAKPSIQLLLLEDQPSKSEGGITEDWKKQSSRAGPNTYESLEVPMIQGGGAQVCSNNKGIKLHGHTIKLWERVIRKRLRRETRVLENQFGFMLRRSTIEVIHLLRSLMEKCRERQKDLHMAFLDLDKAYDSIPRELIWRTLIDKGTSRRYLRVIRDIYKGVKTHVRTTVGNTYFLPMEVGLHQGSTISPYLFALNYG
ncbi:retrovirus-related pol polyprotein LINE-1 [Tanacetum coccineum]